MRRLLRTGSCIGLFLGFLSSSALAQNPAPNWKAIMTGVDGVVVYCLATKDREFQEHLCGKLSQVAVSGFEGSGLKAVYTGVVFGDDNLNPGDPTDPAPFKTTSGIATPLVIRLLVKGNRGSNPGIALGLTISRSFRAAVESGKDQPGLAGDLVFFDGNWIAVGPRQNVVGVVADHGSKILRKTIQEIRKGM